MTTIDYNDGVLTSSDRLLTEAQSDPMDMLPTAKLLVVDDSRMMRMALIRALKDLGISNTEQAANGAEALEKLTQESFDVVLLDIEMPVMGGLEMLTVLKQKPRGFAPPVIVVSGDDQIETAVACIEAGAEDYLSKAFNPTVLRARITASLERKRLRDQEAESHRALIAEHERLEQTQRRLRGELDDAANFVRSIFPPPCDLPLAVDWFQQSSTELGGDAFGYHWIDEDNFAVYLLDVCGHGVGPALLSVTAINQIRTDGLPNVDMRDPGAVLSAMNNIFLMTKQNDLYFTLWYGVYNKLSRTIRHASGGHPPALLLCPDGGGEFSVRRLIKSSFMIGAIEDEIYEYETEMVPDGAILLVPCDGCFEIEDTAGVEVTYEDFEEVMRCTGDQPDALDGLFQWAKARHGPGPLDDDFTIVRVRL
jgi:sigma-B regulation protein RsbU (phosphoserine phosphatase)